jgi:hypothetical protein
MDFARSVDYISCTYEQKIGTKLNLGLMKQSYISSTIFQIKFFTVEETISFRNSFYVGKTICDKPLVITIRIQNSRNICILQHLVVYVYCLLMQIQDFHSDTLLHLQLILRKL